MLGSVAMDIPIEMHRRLSPLTDYLTKSLGRPVQLKLAPNMETAISDLVKGTVDLAYLTPVAYLRAHEQGGAKLVVKTLTGGEGSFQLMVVSRTNSGIKTVQNLKGKRFAFGDKAAILQQAVVASQIPLNQLSEIQFLGHYDNIARGVANGDFDAGILKDTTAYKWERQGLDILYSSPALPPYNIAANKEMSESLVERIKSALISLSPQNPDHKAVIAALDSKYDGFAVTDDKEYDVVRQLIKPFKTTH